MKPNERTVAQSNENTTETLCHICCVDLWTKFMNFRLYIKPSSGFTATLKRNNILSATHVSVLCWGNVVLHIFIKSM